MKEIWKEVKDYPNYKVSNLGKIQNKKGDLMIINKHNKNHSRIILMKNNKQKAFSLGRLVYTTFAMPVGEKNVIFFKDGNPHNCNLMNMMLFENQSKLNSYLLESGITSNPFLKRSVIEKSMESKKRIYGRKAMNKYTSLEVEQYSGDELIATYKNVTDASSKTGIPGSSISRSLSGKFKNAGGFQWKLKENV